MNFAWWRIVVSVVWMAGWFVFLSNRISCKKQDTRPKYFSLKKILEMIERDEQ